MAVLGSFIKQPIEVQDYVIDFSTWLTGLNDTVQSHTVAADTGIVVDSSVMTGGAVQIWLSGGTNGVTYKITVTLTTVQGRVKQSEFKIKVKDY